MTKNDEKDDIYRKKRQTRLLDREGASLDEPDDEYRLKSMHQEAEMKIGRKAAMLLGLYENFPDIVEDNDRDDEELKVRIWFTDYSPQV